MSARMKLRGALPYAVAAISGFLIAYLIVAFVVFPAGVIPGNAKVPNVTGLLYDDAARRLAARRARRCAAGPVPPHGDATAPRRERGEPEVREDDGRLGREPRQGEAAGRSARPGRRDHAFRGCREPNPE